MTTPAAGVGYRWRPTPDFNPRPHSLPHPAPPPDDRFLHHTEPHLAPTSLHLSTCRLFPAKRRMDGSLSWRPQRQTSNGFCLGSAAHTAQLCGHARLSSVFAAHTAQPRGHAHSSSGSAAIRPNRGHARPSLQHTAQARVTLAPARGTAQARGHARPSKSHLNWPDDSTTTSCLPFNQTTGNIAADHYLNFLSPLLVAL